MLVDFDVRTTFFIEGSVIMDLAWFLPHNMLNDELESFGLQYLWIIVMCL